MTYGPKTRVVWAGSFVNSQVRVVVDPDQESMDRKVIAQTLTVSRPPVWGRAGAFLSNHAMSAAIVSLLAPSRPADVSPSLFLYSDLERRALAADGVDEPLADTLRDVLDIIWSTLSEEDRQILNARGVVGPSAGPVGEGEDGDRKA